MNTTLRALAQKAKCRLKSLVSPQQDEQQKTHTSEACLSARVQYAIIANQRKLEDDPLYPKVKRLLCKDIDTLNPLSQLVDQSALEGLTQTEKEKYIYKLGKRYTEIKEHIMKDLQSEGIL